MAEINSAYNNDIDITPLSTQTYTPLLEAYGDILNARELLLVDNKDTFNSETIDAIKIVSRFESLKKDLDGKKKEIELITNETTAIEEIQKQIKDSYDKLIKYIPMYNNKELYESFKECDNKRNNKIYTILTANNDKISKLFDEISVLSTEITSIVDMIKVGIIGIDEDKLNQKLCPICFEREVNICINPCGHTICATCQTGLTKCPTCRSSVSKFIKIFFSV